MHRRQKDDYIPESSGLQHAPFSLDDSAISRRDNYNPGNNLPAPGRRVHAHTELHRAAQFPTSSTWRFMPGGGRNRFRPDHHINGREDSTDSDGTLSSSYSTSASTTSEYSSTSDYSPYGTGSSVLTGSSYSSLTESSDSFVQSREKHRPIFLGEDSYTQSDSQKRPPTANVFEEGALRLQLAQKHAPQHSSSTFQPRLADVELQQAAKVVPNPAGSSLGPRLATAGIRYSQRSDDFNVASATPAAEVTRPPPASLPSHDEDSIIPVGVVQAPLVLQKGRTSASGARQNFADETASETSFIADVLDGSTLDEGPDSRGGYDADFDPPLDGKNQCNICQFALREPVQTDPCGHRFCRSCLEPIISSASPKCPVQDCREPVNAAHPDNFCRREVLSLNVKCRNSVASCHWKGPLKSLKDHLSVCPFSIVPCVYRERGCRQAVQRAKLELHVEQECLYRDISCPYCQEKLQLSDIERHISEECEEAQTECPAGCTMKMRRSQVATHIAVECLVAEQSCGFADIGCQHKMQRAGMGEHLKDAVVNHVSLLHEHILQKDARIQQLEQQYKEMREMFEHLVDERSTDRQARKDLEARMKEAESQLMHLKAVEGKTAELDQRLQDVRTTGSLVSEERVQQLESRVDQAVLRATQADAKAVTASQNAEAAKSRSSNFEHQLAAVNQVIGRTDAIMAEFDLRLLAQETTSFNGVMVWKIPDYNRHYEEARSGKKPSLYSPPFFTSRHGYKMCARVYLNGDGVGKHSHMSVFFVVMRGEFDSLLPWPFHQKVTLTLLDQSPAKKHISDTFLPDPNSSSFQRPTSEMNIASGCPRFVSLETLRIAHGYVKENTIFIRIAVDTTNLPNY